ncbi:MAG: Card1-like endonuclease domain-containing protein [Bacteroidales bacterium]
MFCLVSRQAMANVLPVFMYKPRLVFLFATPEEKITADHLEKLFISKNIVVKRIDDLDAYDYLKFKDCILDELNKLTGDVWLNVTGGTKLMALAAYEAFAEKNLNIIYCNTDRSQIIHLFPKLNTERLILDVSIEDYLRSYGYTVAASRTEEVKKEYFELFEFIELKNLRREFSEFLDEYRKATGSTNPVKTYNDKRNKIFSIQKTTSSVLLFVNKNQFKYEDEKFLKGDWLEYFMLYSLEKQNIKPVVGVKIVSDTNVENEIDIIFIKDYQLYLISCKSGRNTDPNKDIYEIETLRNIAGGTFGKAYLFTVQDLTDRMKQRATDLKIETLTFKNLTHKEFI